MRIKFIVISAFVFLFFSSSAFAQRYIRDTNGRIYQINSTSADTAWYEVGADSTWRLVGINPGALAPLIFQLDTMTTAQRNAIATPMPGMMIIEDLGSGNFQISAYEDAVSEWLNLGAGAAGGETNTVSSPAGSGTSYRVIQNKSGVDFPHKNILEGTNITIDSTSTTITINAAAGGGSALDTQYDGVSQATDTQVYDIDTNDFTLTESPANDFDWQLNANVVQTNQLNVFGDFNQSFRSTRMRIANPANTFFYSITSSAIIANRILTLPLLTAGDTFTFNDFSATLTNKVINDASNTLTILETSITDGTLLARVGSIETITANWVNTANPWADNEVSNTLTSSIFIGSGSTTNAIDLATAEVAGTLGDGNLSSNIPLIDGTNVWTGVNSFQDNELQINNAANTFQYIFGPRAIVADRTVDLPLLTGDDVFVMASFVNIWGNGIRQTFNPSATNPGLNFGSQAGDPSTPLDGDVWYNSTANTFRGRENGANVNLVGGGAGLNNIVEDATPQLGADLDANAFDIQFDDTDGIHDSNDNEQLIFQLTASAVNFIEITNAATAGEPLIQAVGSDTDVSLTLDGQGAGTVRTLSSNLDITGNIIVSGTVDGVDIAGNVPLLDGTNVFTGVNSFQNNELQINNPANTFQIIIEVPAIVADRTVAFPILTTTDVFTLNVAPQTLSNKTLAGGSITTGFGNIDNGASSIAGGSFDASDGNFTNLGQLDVDTIIGDGATLVLGDNSETIQINSSDWDISNTGVATGFGNVTSDGTIEGAVLTEGGNAVPNATDNFSFFAATTSAQWSGVISDEIGTGFAILQTDAIFLGTSLDIGGGASATELRLLEPSGGGTSYTGLVSPALAANLMYTMPTAFGSAGFQLTDAAGDGILSWAAAGAGSATAWDDIANPDNNGLTTITFDNAELSLFTGNNDAVASFFTIQNTDADHVNNLYLLDLDYSADDGDADADFVRFQDSGGTVMTIQQDGEIATDGGITAGGTIEGAVLTEGGNAIFNASETPGGELGGTWASPTIDDGVTVTNWALGTPASMVGTNLTGTGASFTAGVSTLATVTDNESTAEENPLVFVAGADPDGGTLGLETDGTATYNPSTGTITTTEFVGGGVGITGVTAAHAGTINWTGTSILESGVAFQFGDASDATLTHTYANTGTNVSIAYSTAAMAVTGALTATNLSGTNTGDQDDRSKSISVESPTSSEDITMFFTNKAITVTEMRAVLNNGTSTPSVTWTIRHNSDRSATGAEVVTGGTTTTSVSTGSDVTSFNDATIPADSFVWFVTTAQSGTVPNFSVTIIYDED